MLPSWISAVSPALPKVILVNSSAVCVFPSLYSTLCVCNQSVSFPTASGPITSIVAVIGSVSGISAALFGVSGTVACSGEVSCAVPVPLVTACACESACTGSRRTCSEDSTFESCALGCAVFFELSAASASVWLGSTVVTSEAAWDFDGFAMERDTGSVVATSEAAWDFCVSVSAKAGNGTILRQSATLTIHAVTACPRPGRLLPTHRFMSSSPFPSKERGITDTWMAPLYPSRYFL